MNAILYFTKKMHSFAGGILYINLLGMMLIGLLDGFGILLILPLINMSGIVPINTGEIPILGSLSFLQDVPKTTGLLLVLSIYIVLIAGQAWIQRNLSLRDTRIHSGFINYIRIETYRGLLRANWDFYVNKRKSDLINSMTEDLGRVASGTYICLQFLASFVFTLIQIGIALYLSTQLTLFVLICGLALSLLSKRFIRQSKALGSQLSELLQSYLAGITDHFNGVKEIKSNMMEESRSLWLQNWCHMMESERFENAKVANNSKLFYKISSAIFITGFILLSVLLFQQQGEKLLVVILIFSRLWPRFTGIQSNLEQIAAAIPAFKALMELQKECRAKSELGDDNDPQYSQVKPIRFEQALECRSLSFRYNKQESIFALQDINLSIPENRMTAIVGRSGAGKSTLVDILMGLLQPEKGQVLVDGVPLTEGNLLSLRRVLSYVPQDPFIFNGSIRENLLIVEPAASEEQMWEALQFAAAADFVEKLPNRLDTLIGDRGVKLSGGERQRLVLARAILRKPSILVLDEATSALDTENELKIQEALERLRGNMTIIVIAHRLSTVRNADQVVVLDEGKLIQHGEFGQLAKEKDGMFSKLLGNQIMDSKVVSLR